MYNQPHAIHFKVKILKQMSNCLKDYICIFISFVFKKTHLNLARQKWIKMPLMWLNKSVRTINIILKILDFMSLRSLYMFLIDLDLE